MVKSISEKNMCEWSGARWWKFDFHTHTPASYDFSGEDVTPNEWLLAFMREEMDCVVVTDHNSVDWFNKLQEELQKMKENPPKEFRKLVLFPGIEITTNTAGHILAIFSPKTSLKMLNGFFGKLDYNDQEGPQRRSHLSDIEIVKIICENHGLAIPAHLDADASIVGPRTREPAREILHDPSLLAAVELKELKWCQDDLKTEVNKHCFVWGSDTHHLKIDDNSTGYPGFRYTWVKMRSPTFEGLKLALKDKDKSVLPYTNKKNPNEIAHPVIEKIEVKGAKYMGVKESFSCVFNPWMNAIIGGRGTGKSTLIEFLRSGLGKSRQNIENPDSKVDFSAEKVMTEKTKISVYFRKDRMRYRSIFQCNNKTQTEYETASGGWEPTESVNKIFPIQIMSQKEIFRLATNPKRLIEMVNDVPEIKYAQWDQHRLELEAKYIQLCKGVRDAEELIGTKELVSWKLKEIGRKIDLYKVSEDSPVINNYQACIREEQVINSWNSELTSLNNTIKKFPEVSVPQLQLGEEDLSKKIPEQEKLRNSAADLAEKINVGLTKIKDGKRCITEAIDGWENTWTSDPERERIQSAKRTYEEYKKELGKDVEIIENTEMRTKLQHEQQELKKKSKNITKAEEDLEDLKAECKKACSEIIKHRKDLCRTQTQYLNRVFKKSDLRVRIIPFGSKESAVTDFRKMLKVEEDTFRATIWDPGSSNCLLSKLYYTSNTEPNKNKLDMNELERVKGCILRLREEKQDEWIESLHYGTKFQRKLQNTLKDDTVANRLRCWFPDDDLQICFPRQKDYLPLSSGSPGQRSAVFLALILSQGTEPLILDQPEDDLDNKMICHMVVKQLREIKSSRQVIVVTHNANVVINGCAEYIIPLQMEEGETQCVHHGCMHETYVQKEVCSILEGGTEALKQRYQRMIETE